MKAFVKAFSLSLLIMVIPMAGAMTVYFSRQASPPLAQAAEINRQVAPLTVLGALTDDKNGIAAFCLMRIDGQNRNVTLALLPKDLMVEEAGQFSTLSTVWQKNKGPRTAEALKKALDIEIDRSLELRRSDFLAIYNLFGAADVALTEEITALDGRILLTEGRQLVDAKRCFELIYSGHLEAAGSVICNLLEQHMQKLSTSQAEALFNLAANSGKNDLSFADFELRRTKNWKTEAVTATRVAIKGRSDPSAGSFILSADSAQSLYTQFKSD